MFRWKHTRLAFIAITAFAVLLLAWIIFSTDNPVNDYAQQKYLSARVRVAEMLPQKAHAQFVPTPLNIIITFMTDPAPAVTTTPPASQRVTVTPLPSPDAPTASPTVDLRSTQTPVPPTLTPTPDVYLTPIQATVQLTGVKHEAQGWNNCGPTTLMMYLSFYGRNDTQKEIAAFTKPDWDDKNVSPNELAAYVNKTELRVIVRENGTLEQMKQLLSNGLPVMTENGYVTPSGKEGWMGHYKLLTGYDDKEFTTMDSYEGPNVKVAFAAMDADWRAFNRLYIVVYPSDKETTVRAILGNEFDDATMHTNAVTQARAEIAANPQNPFAYFNLGASLNGLQQYKDAAAAFDQARILGLPWRMMWYQFGPYVAYLQTGRYDEVIALADATLAVVDDLEESHYYKGLALLGLGRSTEAHNEFQTALKYNPNYLDAQKALQATSTTG